MMRLSFLRCTFCLLGLGGLFDNFQSTQTAGVAVVSAFTPGFGIATATTTRWTTNSPILLAAKVGKNHEELNSSSDDTTSLSRRGLFTKSITAAGAVFALTSFGVGVQPAVAAGKPPSKEELERIKVGYEGINYLLNNFEQETTICRENGGECKRDADPVRRYMGLRSTTDPLFQIEKVFDKVKYMDDLDPDKLEDFFEATEDWNTSVTLSNSMAFISQFGEYNPGGGKDEVLKYLEESKKQVIIAEKALKKIMDCLEIS